MSPHSPTVREKRCTESPWFPREQVVHKRMVIRMSIAAGQRPLTVSSALDRVEAPGVLPSFANRS